MTRGNSRARLRLAANYRLAIERNHLVRRLLIQRFLPLVFCSVPLVAGLVVAAAIPSAAMHDYLKRLPHSPMDWLILGIGAVLFTAQTILAWRALQWRI